MPNLFEGHPERIKWRAMVEAAKRSAIAHGYELRRVPGRGLSNIWDITKGGETRRASIRTTRDRWIAFPPLEKGAKWKTLDEVETVIVASVDDRDDPENVEVYVFPASEVRKRFKAAHYARTKSGAAVPVDNFGMWVSLDKDERGLPVSVGSGLADEYKKIAVYPIPELIASVSAGKSGEVENSPREVEALESTATASSEPALETIAGVMTWARERVAHLAGVSVDAVKLDLKVAY